ncbi:MAG: hypothetical protein JXB23_03220 [Candidatus Aminicenantes bacterium]|nr:hypothetical protein [Candidatus Aminicenantes bacterium]
MDMPHIQDIKTRLLSTRPFESLLLRKKIGDWVQRDDILAELYLSSIKNPRKLEADIRKIYVLSDKPPPFSPLIAEKTKSGF